VDFGLAVCVHKIIKRIHMWPFGLLIIIISTGVEFKVGGTYVVAVTLCFTAVTN